MKTLNLSQGKVAIIDDGIYTFAVKWKWYAKKHRYTYYAVRAPQKKQGENQKKQFVLHREILKFIGKELKGFQVDHKNGDGLDNRIDNLRIVTHAQNQQNQRKKKNPTSKYKGVCKHFNGYTVHVAGIYRGTFKNEIIAARVYDYYANILFGEYARLNFSDFPLLKEIPKRIYGSKFRGVWKTKNGKYVAECRNKIKKYRSGTFDNEEDAAKQYDKYAQELLGNEAKLNFPDFNWPKEEPEPLTVEKLMELEKWAREHQIPKIKIGNDLYYKFPDSRFPVIK